MDPNLDDFEVMLIQPKDGDHVSDSVLVSKTSNEAQFIVESAPFLAYGLAVDDTVLAVCTNDLLVFQRRQASSGRSVLRVFVEEESVHSRRMLRELGELGVRIERRSRLYTLDVPRDANIEIATDILEQAQIKGIWEWEVGVLGDGHRTAIS